MEKKIVFSFSCHKNVVIYWKNLHLFFFCPASYQASACQQRVILQLCQCKCVADSIIFMEIFPLFRGQEHHSEMEVVQIFGNSKVL